MAHRQASTRAQARKGCRGTEQAHEIRAGEAGTRQGGQYVPAGSLVPLQRRGETRRGDRPSRTCSEVQVLQISQL